MWIKSIFKIVNGQLIVNDAFCGLNINGVANSNTKYFTMRREIDLRGKIAA